MSRSVRDNPPISVNDVKKKSLYETLFDDITENGTKINYVDRHALGELAVTLWDMDNLRTDLDVGESKEVQGDRNMVTKKNPARDSLQKLYPVMLKLFGEFKMTPGSRGKNFGVGGESCKTVDDDFDEV